MGSFAFYRCLSGYERAGARIRTCEISGEWEPEVPVCQRKQLCVYQWLSTYCKIYYGYFISVYRSLYSTTQFCFFSMAVPRAIQCSALSDPAFGSVVLTGRKVGSTATYSCNSGYVLDGSSLRVCQQDGQWSGEAPTCRRMYSHHNKT